MRILLINPNTSPEVTEAVARVAQSVAPPGTTFVPVTGRFGARYIASRASAAIAAHAALDALAEHGEGSDAVYLACFGDPGLAALKELSPVPVVGMAEASCLIACTLGQRFAIVTGGERWGPMLREFVAGQGLSDRFAGVRTIAPTGAAIARDPDSALGSLAEQCKACAADGADVVVLGGAALAGLAARIAPSVPIPVLCSVAAGAQAVVAAAHLRPRKPGQGSFAPTPAAETIGLSAALTRRLG